MTKRKRPAYQTDALAIRAAYSSLYMLRKMKVIDEEEHKRLTFLSQQKLGNTKLLDILPDYFD